MNRLKTYLNLSIKTELKEKHYVPYYEALYSLFFQELLLWLMKTIDGSQDYEMVANVFS